jgi:hypothetical protein
MKQEKPNGNYLMLAGTGAGTQECPEEIKALGYLQSIYRNEMEATPTRMRAAIECLPFENPKLGATAHVMVDGSFAERLERALERSRSPPLLDGTIEHEELVTANDLKKPFQRNFRRFTSTR